MLGVFRIRSLAIAPLSVSLASWAFNSLTIQYCIRLFVVFYLTVNFLLLSEILRMYSRSLKRTLGVWKLKRRVSALSSYVKHTFHGYMLSWMITFIQWLAKFPSIKTVQLFAFKEVKIKDKLKMRGANGSVGETFANHSIGQTESWVIYSPLSMIQTMEVWMWYSAQKSHLFSWQILSQNPLFFLHITFSSWGLPLIAFSFLLLSKIFSLLLLRGTFTSVV